MAYTPDSTGNVILIRADSAAKTTLSGTASAWYRVVGQAAVSIASPAAAYDADLGLWSVALPDAAVVSGVRQGWVTLRDGAGLIGSCPYLVEATTASRSSQASVDAGIAAIQAKTDNLPASPAAVGDIPTTAQIEAALLNEGDGQQLIDAILQRINADLDVPALELSAIASAIRTELAVELARIDANVSSAGGGDDTSILRAVLAGLRTVTHNGDATKTARCFAADGVTAKVDLTFDAQGQITAVEVDPA